MGIKFSQLRPVGKYRDQIPSVLPCDGSDRQFICTKSQHPRRQTVYRTLVRYQRQKILSSVKLCHKQVLYLFRVLFAVYTLEKQVGALHQIGI